MTDNRIKEFKYHLETINGYLFDEKVEEITNWIRMTLTEKEDALIDIEERKKEFIKHE